MTFDDEKDYIMRIIKEMVRILFSLMLGKRYVAVEMERDNGYEVSGRKLSELLELIDRGEINKAENLLFENLYYSDKNSIAAAALFYQYLSEKGEEFLVEHDYSKEEVFDGIKRLMRQAGYSGVIDIVEETAITEG